MDEPPSSVPSMIAEFRLIRPLGRGGMGEVYLGHDTLLDRAVAVKLLHLQQLGELTQGQHLVEARAAARIQHPNVVTVHRVGEVGGRPFIVTELVQGLSLDDVALPLPQARALEIAIGLSRGLAAAHRRGVLHRDIKPGNAIVTEDGEVKLLDFGLAKLVDLDALRDASSGKRPSKRPHSGVLARKAPRDGDEGRQPALSDPRARPTDDRPTVPIDPAVTAASDPHGVILGTPLYMAPEIWNGQPASRRSDVYSMGVLMFELCAGRTPFAEVSYHQLAVHVICRDPPPVARFAPALDPRLAEIIDHCLSRDPNKRYSSADELREALEQVQARLSMPPIPEGNPYRGLLSFEAEHRALFFGRDIEIGTILDRLRSDAFVCVAGDSGAGKSSLCRAGVVPRVLERALDPRRRFEAVELVPGRHPLESLAAALAPILKTSEPELCERIRKDPAALRAMLSVHLGEDQGLLLFVDQLEELLTISDAAEAAAVGEALARLVIRSAGLRVLATVRGDFLARATAIAGLGDELTPALYLLKPLSPEKIREAIVGPARVKGATFESDDLIELIIASTSRAEGGLPLLQFALAELWEAKESSSKVITARSLEQIGGVEGALARHADHVLDRMPAAHQAAAWRILGLLVTLERTRARRTEQELVAGDPNARPALDALVGGRLLVAREAQGGTACEIAHEALLTGWFTLRKWLDEQADARAVKDRLEQAAAAWARLGKRREALWGAAQVAEAAKLEQLAMSDAEKSFLLASQRRVRNERRVRLLVLMVAPVMLVCLYVGMTLRARSEVRNQIAARVGSASAALADAERKKTELDDLERRAFAAFDGQDSPQGEKLWTELRRVSGALDARYRDAAHDAASALELDTSRADVQKKLADILYKRVLHAERSRNAALVDELRERLSAYDASGEYRRLLDAPAQIRVETEPPGAGVRLESIALEPEAPAKVSDSKDLGAAPVSGLKLAPGSYLLTLRLSGKPEVKYPIVAKRGENLSVRIVLPGEEQIPKGFIYIPEGRFLFGSSDEETVRKSFLYTVPTHEVKTGPYLIAKYETTFGEWIEYLKTLPLDHPTRESARSGGGEVTGVIDLSETPDGRWQISFRWAGQKVTAKSDEPFLYPARTKHAKQSWLRMPVGGVSIEDIDGYLSWLDRTGRVPGARLCTDYEWERAARGADERSFPHGNVLEPEDANFDETQSKLPNCMGPDEIGAHPRSSSVFGAEDMAGNVFEWVRSSLSPDESPLRGGAYFFDQVSNRANNRFIVDRHFRDPRVGFRACATIHLR